MSFVSNDTSAKTYAPGFFRAHEECTRVTKEISQEGAVDTESGGKYVPMGTAYPSNDGNAIGIVYEDVDVTNGNMPGSVVTKGEVYEDRLAITSASVSYDAVTPVGTEDPSEEGWYERSGSEGSYVYTLSTDTTVDNVKMYYEKNEDITRLSSDAKSALEALGFKFVTTVPVVERPY